MLNQLLITFNLLAILAIGAIVWHEYKKRKEHVDMIMKEINKLINGVK